MSNGTQPEDEERSMNLLKLHNQIINLDQVTDIVVDDDGVLLFFTPHRQLILPKSTSSVPESTVVSWRFEGDEATALRQWLEEQSTDITPPRRYDYVPAPPDDPENTIVIDLDEDNEDDRKPF